jgi:hypothetical protein
VNSYTFVVRFNRVIVDRAGKICSLVPATYLGALDRIAWSRKPRDWMKIEYFRHFKASAPW